MKAHITTGASQSKYALGSNVRYNNPAGLCWCRDTQQSPWSLQPLCNVELEREEDGHKVLHQNLKLQLQHAHAHFESITRRKVYMKCWNVAWNRCRLVTCLLLWWNTMTKSRRRDLLGFIEHGSWSWNTRLTSSNYKHEAKRCERVNSGHGPSL